METAEDPHIFALLFSRMDLSLGTDLSWLSEEFGGGERKRVEALLREHFHPGFRVTVGEISFEITVLAKLKSLIGDVPSLAPVPRLIVPGHERKEEEPFLNYVEHREEVILYYSELAGDDDLSLAVIYRDRFYFELGGIAAWIDKRLEKTSGSYWRRGLETIRKISCVTYSLFVEGDPPGCIWLRTGGRPRRPDEKRVFKSQYVSALVVFILCIRFTRNQTRHIDPDRQSHTAALLAVLDLKYGCYGNSEQRAKIMRAVNELPRAEPDAPPPPVAARNGAYRWSYLHRDYRWPRDDGNSRKGKRKAGPPRPRPGERRNIATLRSDFAVLGDYNRNLLEYMRDNLSTEVFLEAKRTARERAQEKHGKETVGRVLSLTPSSSEDENEVGQAEEEASSSLEGLEGLGGLEGLQEVVSETEDA